MRASLQKLAGERQQHHAGQHHEGAGGDLAHLLLLSEEQGADGEREEDLDLLDGLDIGRQREKCKAAPKASFLKTVKSESSKKSR